MKFQYSVIGDNTPENREWLEKVGYEQGYVWSKDSNLIFAVEGIFCIHNNNAVYKYARIYDTLIDCRGNPPLFKAVSAMRDDSDFGQIFIDDNGTIIRCMRSDISIFSEYINPRKLSLVELQERFKI